MIWYGHEIIKLFLNCFFFFCTYRALFSFVSISLSIYLRLSYLLVYLSISICFTFYVSIHFYLFYLYLSIYLSIYLPISIYLSLPLSVYLSNYLFIYLSVYTELFPFTSIILSWHRSYVFYINPPFYLNYSFIFCTFISVARDEKTRNFYSSVSIYLALSLRFYSPCRLDYLIARYIQLQ